MQHPNATKNSIPAGLVTGIGSLPFITPGEALPLIMQHCPQAPHWPQLPRRGGREGFVFQFLTPLLTTRLLRLEGDKAVFSTDSPDWPAYLTEFYTIYLAAEAGEAAALEYFALPEEAAVGFHAFVRHLEEHGPGAALFYKGHQAGPLTIALQLKDHRGRIAYYDDQLRDLVVKSLAMNARWQVSRLCALGRPVIFFVDEPAIGVCGNSNYITVTRQMVLDDLNAIFDQVHAAGGTVGVHSCDGIDWSLLYESRVDIVNLDAFDYWQSLLPYAAEMKGFLARGGVMAMGLVPTNPAAWQQTADTLLEHLNSIFSELAARGVLLPTLKRQTMITPACGTGLLEPDLAVHIYSLSRQAGEKFAREVAALD